MKTAKLRLRTLTTNTLADAIWHVRDGAQWIVVPTVISSELHAASIGGKRPLIKPDPSAASICAFSGRRALDSGRPVFGDVWEVRRMAGKRTIAICTGDYKDFNYRSLNAVGVGYSIESKGNILYLHDDEFSGPFPLITMTKRVEGITLVKGILTVQDGTVATKYTPLDLKWTVHHSVSFDGTSFVGDADGNNTASFTSHTVGGANRFLFVGLSNKGDQTSGPDTPTITFNSVSMTNIWTVRNDTPVPAVATAYYSRGYGLVAPDTGARTISINTGNETSPYNIVAGAISLAGVDQSTPYGTAVTKTNHDSTEPSVTVTTATGEMIVDCANVQANTSTPGANQTERWDSRPFNTENAGVGSTQDGASGGTVSWTRNSPSAAHWAMGAVSVKAASGGGGSGKPNYYYVNQQIVGSR